MLRSSSPSLWMLGVLRRLRRIRLPLAARNLLQRLLPHELAKEPAFLVPDLTVGLSALEAGQTSLALRHLRPLAEQGVAEAEYRLGILCLYGLGLVQDAGDAVFGSPAPLRAVMARP